MCQLSISLLSAQINPECVPRLSLKMWNGWMLIANIIIFLIKLNGIYIYGNNEHLLAGSDSKGPNKSHDRGLTQSTGKPRSWPHALKVQAYIKYEVYRN